MNTPYADYADEHGGVLHFGVCDDPAHLPLRVTDEAGTADVCIARTDLAGIFGQTVGLPVPVIGDSYEFEGLTFEVRPGHGVDVTRVRPDGGRSGTLYPPEAMSQVAASIAALAARSAESEPDPAEVEALAREMCGQALTGTGTPPEGWLIAARTALRWMMRRERSVPSNRNAEEDQP